jgi:glycosyltransferase involved in cell wall biosynthesis
MPAAMTPLRVAIVCDFIEEDWPSMQMVGEMLFDHLRKGHSAAVHATLIRPAFVRRLSRIPGAGRIVFNADRLLNRLVDYPRVVRRLRDEFDIFHIVDHSYSHLVHEIPRGRAIVTCHDLDTFRCVLEPGREPRSRLFRVMTRRILDGLQNAVRVICNTNTTRAELLRYRLVPPSRLNVIRYGVHPAFSSVPDKVIDRKAAQLLGPPTPDRVELLHVGSAIPRKRLDVLLNILKGVREEFPNIRLIRVGGSFTSAQKDYAQLRESIRIFPSLTAFELAPVYRRAAMTLLPSESEGFGLPIIESLACGTPVVASDIASTREAGGPAAEYCPVADVSAWVDTVVRLLHERAGDSMRWSERQIAGLAWSAKFSWAEHAGQVAAVYNDLQTNPASLVDHLDPAQAQPVIL